MLASHVSQIIDALSGTAGAGQPIILTKLNDASAYALDVANADSTNSYGLRVQDSAGNNLLLVYKNNVTVGASAANDTLTINANISGKVYIGDSSNANMTVGLTINQGANDDEILAFKSSDVAHGVTALTETDTFATFSKGVADTGGLVVYGFTENLVAINLTGVATTATGTRSTAAVAPVYLRASLKSGTGTASVGTDKNLVVITDAGTTRFIFDTEGSAHADVEWTTFDDHDDVALLSKLDAAMTRDPIKTEFGRYLGDYREELQAAKVVNFYDDGPRAMVDFTRLAMLHTGAIRQLGQQNAAIRAELTEMRQKLLPEVA